MNLAWRGTICGKLTLDLPLCAFVALNSGISRPSAQA
jgi:hypothetical protein